MHGDYRIKDCENIHGHASTSVHSVRGSTGVSVGWLRGMRWR
jgi:hypothetical protein